GIPGAPARDRTTGAERGSRDRAELFVVGAWPGASALEEVTSAPIVGGPPAKAPSRSASASSAPTVTTGSLTRTIDAQRSRDAIQSGRKLQVPSASWQRKPKALSTVRWRARTVSVWPKSGCQR